MKLEKLEKLETEYLARNILCYENLESTQVLAKELVQKNVPNGSIIIAKNQTNGQGTHGRKWITNSNKNATFTLILYPHCNINKLENLSIAIAQSIQKAVKKEYDIELQIKEPNDLIYNDRKIAGILTEISTREELVENLYIGIGFNVNQTEFLEELKNKAISLKMITGKEEKIENVISVICNELEEILKNRTN